MDRAELVKIGRDTADKIIRESRVPKTIEHGLAVSIGEERAAAILYEQRAEMTDYYGDKETSALYREIAKDEKDHLAQLNGRLIQKGGSIIFPDESRGGWVIRRDKEGDILFSHTGRPDIDFLSEQDENSIWDILTPEERNSLDRRNIITVPDSEPRSHILSEIEESQSAFGGSSQASDPKFLVLQRTKRAPKNFTVWSDDGMVMVKPPIWNSDIEGLKSDLNPGEWLHEPTKESMVIPQNVNGEVISAETKDEILVALYDAYQTSDVLKPGDTFTMKGESEPFAKCTDIHVLPV
jgi:hypothetical protein